MKLHLAIVPILLTALVVVVIATPRPAADIPYGTPGASSTAQQRTGAPRVGRNDGRVAPASATPTPDVSGAPKPSGGIDKGFYCSEPTCGYVEPTAKLKPTALTVYASSITGTASWYAYIPGGAAAGPRLRAFLGPHWRGAIVRVCAGSSCVVAQLSDWCACNTGAEKLIDLDKQLFAALAPLSRGVVRITLQVVGR